MNALEETKNKKLQQRMGMLVTVLLILAVALCVYSAVQVLSNGYVNLGDCIVLLSGWLLTGSGVPEWLNITVNSLYFVTNVVTTSAIARYLFVRILEHTHHRHCMRNASIALASILGVYMLIVIVNLWTGILFYFDENGNYDVVSCALCQIGETVTYDYK